MSKLLLASFILLVVVASAFSQSVNQQTSSSKCNLTLANSPAIRGLRLGMTAEELMALFPGSAESNEVKNELALANNYPAFGVTRLSFASWQYPSAFKERFAGIESVLVTLLDKRVTEFTVQYSSPSSSKMGVNWHGTEEFIARLSENFHLPPASYWELRSPGTLSCNGFEISVWGDSGGRIMLRDNSYLEQVKERQMADDERRRREFKP